MTQALTKLWHSGVRFFEALLRMEPRENRAAKNMLCSALRAYLDNPEHLEYDLEQMADSSRQVRDLLEQLPNEVKSLVRIVQDLVIHEFVAGPFYGIVLSDKRRSESHIRPVEQMIDRILARDSLFCQTSLRS